MQGSSRPNGLFSCIWSAFLRKKQLNQGAPRKKTPVAHGLADRRAFKQKAPRPVTGGAQFLAFSLSQLLSSLHDFDDLGECFRIGDGGDETVRLHIGQGISGIASLSPPRLVNTSRSGSRPCRPARIQSKSAPPCYRRSAISRVFAKSAIKQPSRLRRPWRMLPDRRRPCPREPCGSSGCWPWKACK